VQDNALLSPGRSIPENSFGQLTIAGSYTQNPQGAMLLEIGGPAATGQFDRFAIGGAATFGGTLRVNFLNAFNPLPGSAFEVLSFASRTGDMTVVTDTGFAGLTVTKSYTPTTLTLLMSAIGGDANLDAHVDLLDFNLLAANFGFSGKNWFTGDFNNDGVTNLIDFNILAAHFGQSAGPDGIVDPQDWANLASAIPEPVMIVLPLAASACLLRRRRQVCPD
jgi:hypothetical protein